MKWTDLSEIVIGKMLLGLIPPGAIDPVSVCEPYPELVRRVSKKGTVTSDEAIELIGIQAYASAVAAAQATETINSDFVNLLTRAASRHEAADMLSKAVKKIQGGEEYDPAQLISILDKLSSGGRSMIRMSEVEPEVNPFIETGWEVLDKYMGGLPAVGMTMVAGPPGTGKTTLMLKTITNYVKKHDCDAAIFTLEMTTGQLTARTLEVMKISKKIQSKIFLCEEVLSPTELAAMAARGAKYGIIAVDFAELMIDSEISESVMAKAYRTLASLSKQLKVPLLVLSQLNRSYDGSLPRLSMIRYTGLGEALTPMALLLYNPNAIWVNPSAAETLPIVPEHAYIIQAKSRFGYKSGMGAALVPFKDAAGWGDKPLKWVKLSPTAV